jgi:hypothetical protein
MQARNPQYNSVGTIDLEIDHPSYGWIPFTASPDDANGADIYAQAVAGEYGEIAPYVAPEPVPPTAAQIEAMRKAAYQDEADPLFFKWQRGESTEAAWLAKIAEIKARYPEPEA